MATITGDGEWRRGWRLVLAAALGTGMASTQAVTLGTFVAPLGQAFGWGRAEITGGLAIGSLGTILLTPLLGTLVDRVGARRVVLVGVWFYALAVALLGTAGPGVSSWYARWALVAVFCMGMNPVAWTMAVASRFERHRGLALAVTLAGLNIATMLLPLLAVRLIDAIGWRWSYAVLGGLALVIVLPPTLAWFDDAKGLGRKQAGAPLGAAGRPHRTQADAPGLTLREAAATGRFWRMLGSLALVGGSVSALSVHFLPMMTDAGLSRTEAALVLGLLGPISFVSRLGTGWLLDRIPAPLVAGPAFALPVISCLILQHFDGHIGTALVVAALNGVTVGAEVDLIAFLASRYFGMRQFGAIYGCAFSCFTIGYGAMPVLAGRIYDTTGSYASILSVLAAMLAGSSFLAFTLGRYPRFPGQSPMPVTAAA
jgi:MFS family permease